MRCDISSSFTSRPSGPRSDSSFAITPCSRTLTSSMRLYSSSSRSALPMSPSPASMRERMRRRCAVESDASDSRPLNGSSGRGGQEPPSSSGAPPRRAGDVHRLLAQQAQRAQRRLAVGGDAVLHRAVELASRPRPCPRRSAAKLHVRDRAHLDAAQPHRRAGLEAVDVGHERLHLVLAGRAACRRRRRCRGSVEGQDDQAHDHHQARRAARSRSAACRSVHRVPPACTAVRGHERNSRRYGSADVRSSCGVPSNWTRPSRSIRNSVPASVRRSSTTVVHVLVVLLAHERARDVERVAQLVGDQDGADAVQVAHLHDQVGDRGGGDRVEAGRRLVVEHELRPRHQRARDRHAPALAAGELARACGRRSARGPRSRASRARAPRSPRPPARRPRPAGSRRSRRRSASRRARPPGRPCRS